MLRHNTTFSFTMPLLVLTCAFTNGPFRSHVSHRGVLSACDGPAIHEVTDRPMTLWQLIDAIRSTLSKYYMYSSVISLPSTNDRKGLFDNFPNPVTVGARSHMGNSRWTYLKRNGAWNMTTYSNVKSHDQQLLSSIWVTFINSKRNVCNTLL